MDWLTCWTERKNKISRGTLVDNTKQLQIKGGGCYM